VLRNLEATEARLARNAKRQAEATRGKLVQELLPLWIGSVNIGHAEAAVWIAGAHQAGPGAEVSPPTGESAFRDSESKLSFDGIMCRQHAGLAREPDDMATAFLREPARPKRAGKTIAHSVAITRRSRQRGDYRWVLLKQKAAIP